MDEEDDLKDIGDDIKSANKYYIVGIKKVGKYNYLGNLRSRNENRNVYHENERRCTCLSCSELRKILHASIVYRTWVVVKGRSGGVEVPKGGLKPDS